MDNQLQGLHLFFYFFLDRKRDSLVAVVYCLGDKVLQIRMPSMLICDGCDTLKV